METKFLKIAMAAMVLNTAFAPVQDMVARLAGYVLIVAILLYAICGFNWRRCSIHVLAIGLLFVWTICAMLIGQVRHTMDYIQKSIMLIALMLCLVKAPEDRSVKNLDFFFNCNACLALVFIAYAFLPVPFKYTQMNEYGYMGFTMGLGNPNATSISVTSTFMLLIVELQMNRSKKRRVFNMIAAALLAVVLLKLESRTCLLCAFLFVFGILVFTRRSLPPKLLMIGAIGISIVSIAIHIWLATVDGIVLFGKPLASGRSEMLLEVFASLKKHPSTYFLGRPDLYQFRNYHNAPISLLCNIGIAGMIEYYVLWYRMMKQVQCKALTQTNAMSAYLALLVFVVASSSEAGPLLGSIPFLAQIAVFIHIGLDIEGTKTVLAVKRERKHRKIVWKLT